MDINYYEELYSNLPDDDLLYELLRCTNDSYLLRTPEEQAAADYWQRHDAVWAELGRRKK